MRALAPRRGPCAPLSADVPLPGPLFCHKLLPPLWAFLTWIPDVVQVGNEVAVVSVFTVILDLEEKQQCIEWKGDLSLVIPCFGVPVDWAEPGGREEAACPSPSCVGRDCLVILCHQLPGLTGLFQGDRTEALGQLPGKEPSQG